MGAWKKGLCARVAGKEMEFYQIHSFEDLEKGAYGILEPKKECPVYEAGEGQTTLAILPGSVFDEKRTVSVMAVDFMIVILKNGKISAGSQLLMNADRRRN